MLKLLGLVLLALSFGIGLTLVMMRWIHRSEDAPSKLIFKWGLSLLVCGAAIGYAAKARNGFEQIAAILFGAVCGLVMAITWAPNFCAWVARPFASLYDGGDIEPDPEPVYGTAEARLKRGDPQGAVEEIQNQLALFPLDLNGHLKLAQIQAEHFQDLPSAAQTIWDWVSRNEHLSPGALALALNRLADWQLSIGKDPQAARETLERIAQLAPNSEQASLAAQRVARLPTVEFLESTEHSQVLAVPQGPKRLGLQNWSNSREPAQSGETSEIDQCVARLNEFPQDCETREKLAVLYEERLGRPDLALEQLQQLVEQPFQPPKHTSRWLHLLADLHVRNNNEAAARECLERIITSNPDGALADQARQRLSLVGMEIRGQKKSQAVKLGSYEKNLGLKPKAG